MCTARPPFRSETSYGTLQRICESQPRLIREVNPEIPPWLAAFIDRLHEKKPDDRFQTAHEVAQLLEQCLAHVRQPDVAPLPAAVIDLITKHIHAPMRRAAWHFLSTPRPRRAASLIVATIAVLVTAGWLTVRLWPSAEPAAPSTDSRAVVVEGSNSKPAAVEAAVSPKITTRLPSDDEITNQLLKLKSDVDRLERRMSVIEGTHAAPVEKQHRDDRSIEHSNRSQSDEIEH